VLISAWLDGFFARNNELVLRKPEKLSNIRARNLNPIALQKYFADLGTILTDLNLKNASNRIWNMDCHSSSERTRATI
jgi:hypothetical protein